MFFSLVYFPISFLSFSCRSPVLVRDSLSTGHTTFVDDTIRKYEHVIQRAVQNIDTHDFREIHCNNMAILDQERRKHRGKGQANAQVSFQPTKRAPIGYYYRCKYISVHKNPPTF